VLNAKSPHAKIDFSSFEKVHYLPFQPTSENLVIYFVELIKELLLDKIILFEKATSFTERNYRRLVN